MKISTRVIVLAVLALLLVGSSLIGLAYKSMHDGAENILDNSKMRAYESRRSELKNEMRIVHGMLMATYKKMKNENASDEDIKSALKENIKDVRFFEDNSGYVFIYEYDGTCVALPTNPSLEGKHIINLKDKNGVFLCKALV